MKKSYKDLSSKIYGKLKVLTFVKWYTFSTGQRRSVWKCLCECGEFTEVFGGNLTSGHTKSCGCHALEIRSLDKITHGGSTTPEYSVYSSMIARCSSDNKDYGGRGIEVCTRWLEESPVGFLNFLKDMGNRPDSYEIDRIDVDGNYEPSNCRWVDLSIQSFNKRKRIDNTSGKTGVIWNKQRNKWQAMIHKDKKKIHLGFHNTFEEAVISRKDAEMKYYNFKLKDYKEF